MADNSSINETQEDEQMYILVQSQYATAAVRTECVRGIYQAGFNKNQTNVTISAG